MVDASVLRFKSLLWKGTVTRKYGKARASDLPIISEVGTDNVI